jgi:hypothetical protein
LEYADSRAEGRSEVAMAARTKRHLIETLGAAVRYYSND